MVIASPVPVSRGLPFSATSVFACGRRMVDSGHDVKVISGCCDW